MYDFSDVEPQQSSDLIADGSFAKVIMTIRPGGIDGQTEIDRGLGGTMADIAVYDTETFEQLGRIEMPDGADQALASLRLIQR